MIIEVKVSAGLNKSKVTKVGQKLYKIRLTKPREKGKANEELISLLAEYFNVKKRNISIVRGYKSPHKVVEVTSI